MWRETGWQDRQGYETGRQADSKTRVVDVGGRQMGRQGDKRNR